MKDRNLARGIIIVLLVFISIAFGDMAEALHQLRTKYGLYYNPSEREIFEEAKLRIKNE